MLKTVIGHSNMLNGCKKNMRQVEPDRSGKMLSLMLPCAVALRSLARTRWNKVHFGACMFASHWILDNRSILIASLEGMYVGWCGNENHLLSEFLDISTL